MKAFLKQSGKLIGTQDGFGPLDHISHGLGIVVIGYFEVNRNMMLGIGGGLDVIGDFGDVVSDDHLPTVRIGSEELLLITHVQLFMKGFIVGLVEVPTDDSLSRSPGW